MKTRVLGELERGGGPGKSTRSFLNPENTNKTEERGAEAAQLLANLVRIFFDVKSFCLISLWVSTFVFGR